MGFSTVIVPAADVARATADKNLLVGNHRIFDNGAVAGRWNTAGDFAVADDSDPLTPAKFGVAKRIDIVTKRLTADTVSFLMYRNSITPFGPFDVAMIAGHTFGSTTTLVEIIISDDGKFDGTGLNQETIASFAGPFGTSKRLVSIDLKHTGAVPLRYSGVENVAVKVTTSIGLKPEIGEFWLGQRIQFHHKTDRPDRSHERRSVFRDFQTDSQAKFRQVLADTQAAFTGNWVIHDPTLEAEYNQFLLDVKQGAESFLYIENPGTAPAETHQMWAMNSPIPFPELGVELNRTSLEMEEAPIFLDLEL